jgi:hypothetical protein
MYVEGFSSNINSPITVQIMQLESHGSQLSGAKNRTILNYPVQILLQRKDEKVAKSRKFLAL